MLGPVLTDIQATLHLDGAAAGLLNALPLLLFAVLSLIAPGIGRRHGLERILGAALGAILVGTLLRSLWLPAGLWIGTLLLSAGIAFGNVLLPGLVKRDFPDHAAGMIGLYAAAMAGMAGLSAGLGSADRATALRRLALVARCLGIAVARDADHVVAADAQTAAPFRCGFV